MIPRLYVVGGEKGKSGVLDPHSGWPLYQKAIIVEIDLNKQKTQRVVEYVSPPDVGIQGEDSDIVFKSGTLKDNKLYVCTKTEVLIYSFPEFEKIGYFSLPCFNDLHHVYPTKHGTLLIVVTGLDLVLETTEQGEIKGEWNVLGEPPWKRFSKSIDYRMIASTKPHQGHPNYAFQLDNRPWVTRFEQRDAICLTDSSLCINIGLEKPHDGIPYHHHVYFTTVDGHVVIADQATRCTEIFDLNTIGKTSDISLGWCRGIKVVDDYQIIVGFSGFRSTKYQDNIKWVKGGIGAASSPEPMPTRIARYDLKRGELLWEFDLEAVGMNIVYSIH